MAAGFDALHGDPKVRQVLWGVRQTKGGTLSFMSLLMSPQGEMSATPAGFAHLTHFLMGLAGGKLILSLEVSNSPLSNPKIPKGLGLLYLFISCIYVYMRGHTLVWSEDNMEGLALSFHHVDSFGGLNSGLVASPLIL